MCPIIYCTQHPSEESFTICPTFIAHKTEPWLSLIHSELKLKKQTNKPPTENPVYFPICYLEFLSVPNIRNLNLQNLEKMSMRLLIRKNLK